MATVSGYVGFRRLRPSVRWPIFMVRSWTEGRGDQLVSGGWEPLEPSESSANGFPIVKSFSNGNTPEILPVKTAEGCDFVLGEGPVGNEGAFDCFWGEMMRGAVDLYADRGDTGEFGAAITAPAETLISDIIVDESLPFALKPGSARLRTHLRAGAADRHARRSTHYSHLSIDNELPGSPPLVTTPLVPRTRNWSTGVPADGVGTQAIPRRALADGIPAAGVGRDPPIPTAQTSQLKSPRQHFGADSDQRLDDADVGRDGNSCAHTHSRGGDTS